MGTAGRELLFERGGGGAAGGGGGGGATDAAAPAVVAHHVVENHHYRVDDKILDRQQCRLCASDVDADERIDIFAEDSRRKYLQTKIRKYLYILVSAEDKLSKMVCSTCARRLDGVHRFATMAYRTQERLRLRFNDERRSSGTTIAAEASRANSDDVDKEKYILENEARQGQQQQKDRGLLHSILTKQGGMEIVAEKEASSLFTTVGENFTTMTEAIRDETSQSSDSVNTEEMEVRLDPMIFLECDLEEADVITDYSDESDEVKCGKDGKDTSSPGRINSTGESRSSIREIAPSTRDRGDKDCSSEESKVTESDEEIGDSATKSCVCTICSRSFVSQMALQNHLWSHLPRERRYEIGKPVLRSSGHTTHGNNNGHYDSRTNDNNSIVTSGNFVCPICSKRISTKGNLKVHLETHRPKGKYGCDICGRIFKTQSNLFRHKEYHGGIQFPCNVCGRVYPTNSTLRAHSITHSDLRPHACPLCDKTFKRNQDLKFHINQHTGARPYQCPYCPKAFASSGNCFSHRKRMHPREVHRDRQRAADLMR